MVSAIASAQTTPFTRAAVLAQILLDFGGRRHRLAHLSHQFAGRGLGRLVFFARQFLVLPLESDEAHLQSSSRATSRSA
jgi:hypothetical protein